MSTKAILGRAGVLAWLAGGVALAGDPIRPAGMFQSQPMESAPAAPAVTNSAASPGDAAVPAITHPPALPAGSVCSPWTGPGGTGCCGPVGGNGPILSEFFFRTGVNFLISGNILKDTLQSGTVQSFGARSLFFNPEGSKAWTAEIGIDYFFNNSTKGDQEFPIDVISPPNNPDIQTTLFAGIREYHRAALHVAFGRELFMYAPAYNACRNFRFGWDLGGRYGYSRLNLNVFPENPDDPTEREQFNKRADTFGTFFVSLHADAEFPVFECKSFVVGIRSEYGYNWSDIVQLFDSDTQEVNIMLNFGLKY
jgi:hypothetical protein